MPFEALQTAAVSKIGLIRLYWYCIMLATVQTVLPVISAMDGSPIRNQGSTVEHRTVHIPSVQHSSTLRKG